MQYRLGLPMWSNKSWHGSFFSQKAQSGDFLAEYASVFNTVEGSTTFYAIPSEASVTAWDKAAPEDFRFSFKLPKLITHELKLQRCDLSVTRFFERIEPLHNRMGPIMIQLPPGFDGKSLPVLAEFIKKLPASAQYAVEVRHLDYFDKDHYELQLNELLEKYRIDRVCFDSRGLFESPAIDEATIDAQAKKPSLPVHARGLAKHPVVRFIGHSNIDKNEVYFSDWVKKIVRWLELGKEPYVFIHMADNATAPQLALKLHQQLQQYSPEISQLPSWPVEREGKQGQIGLF